MTNIDAVISRLSSSNGHALTDYIENTMQFLASSCRTVMLIGTDYVCKIPTEPFDQPRCDCFDNICVCDMPEECDQPHEEWEVDCECNSDEDDAYQTGQNRAEAAFWNLHKDDAQVAKHLVPVIASDPDGRWLIAKKVIPWRQAQRIVKVTDETLYAFYVTMQEIGIYDMHERNMGYDPDTQCIVALDYGISSEWEDITGLEFD